MLNILCGVRKISYLKRNKTNENLFRGKEFKSLSKTIIIIYCLLMLIYMFRDNLYMLDNQYITLFTGTAPNLIGSCLFTLLGIFYIVPFIKGIESINKPILIWLINVVNMIVFSLIEYLHVIFNLGFWDNNDIIASLIGIITSTVLYFKLRNNFIRKNDN